MTLSRFIHPEEEPEETAEADEPQAPPPPRTTKRVVHRARVIHPAAPPQESSAPPEDAGETGSMGSSMRRSRFETRLTQRRRQAAGEPQTSAGAGTIGSGQRRQRFINLTSGVRQAGETVLVRKQLVRSALWDFASISSLVVNAILIAVVILLALRINTLQRTLSGLLGGLYDNFVRMDRSYITTTIAVEDMPIPLDFTLPVVQEQTNVVLTQAVTVRNARVIIDTGEMRIDAPSTVTLPAGTSLPVSLRMDVPVQTTVLVDLLVPVNIELARANSSDPAIANLHTAFLGLQDTIGPLYCLLQPTAVDYLSQPLCGAGGMYISRTAPTP